MTIGLVPGITHGWCLGTYAIPGGEFKAQVLSECQHSGASMAAVALSHALNVNLLRKWLVGRGLKRAGLTARGR